MRVSSGILSVLGLLHKLGLPFIGLRTWIRQAHFTRPVEFLFILFNCPLHPFWSVIIEKEDQMGWQLKIYGLTVQGLWVDGSND